MRCFRFAACVSLAFTLTVPALAQRATRGADPLAGFDGYVSTAMKAWKVPGLAVAIVKGDSVVFAKGFGVRKIGEATPVDAHTIFAIGSASKAFTGAAIGLLVDEGKAKWDDQVTTHLPWFEAYDPWVTREIRIRDLLTHRSGLSRGDNLWYGTSRTRDEVVRGVRNLKPTWTMRTQFGYQNLMFITAGRIVEERTGKSWDDVIKTRFFGPLNMTSSNTSTKDLAGLPNVATPHAEIDDTVQVVGWRNIDNAGPAGSINSNVIDMSNWIRMWLGKGRFGGKQILSQAVRDEAITPQFVINDPFWHIIGLNEAKFVTYGFGWAVQDFRGKRLVHHGGNIDGMSAMVAFMPDDDIGVVVLSNLNGAMVTMPVVMNALDRELGIKPARDYSTALGALLKPLEAQGKAAAAKRDAAHVHGTKPSLPLEAYGGTYSNELYGKTTISLENGALVLHPDLTTDLDADLVHWHFDTFQARMRTRMLGKELINFELGPDGKVARLVRGPDTWTKDGAKPTNFQR
ncbi:MAG: serine hydrolase [Gemmatimonadota bacterium]